MNKQYRKQYRVEYLPAAREDLLDIFEYILMDNPDAAADFIDRIDTTISRLGSFPAMGPIPNDDRLQLFGYRMLIIEKYIAFYVILDDVIEIRRIIHGRRRYSFLLD